MFVQITIYHNARILHCIPCLKNSCRPNKLLAIQVKLVLCLGNKTGPSFLSFFFCFANLDYETVSLWAKICKVLPKGERIEEV